MNRTLSLNKYLVTFGIPLSLLVALIALMQSPFLIGNDILSMAITADLALTVPLIYFLLIRKTTIPKTTVIPVMIAGVLIGSFFLPGSSQKYLNLFKTWALPAIELSILAYVAIKVRHAVRKYKRLKGSTPDFFSALKNVCSDMVPRPLVWPLATEIAVIYYGFFSWKTRAVQGNEFTCHKKSGTPALLGAFVFIIVIETIVLHILLAMWSVVAAWIVSGLSIYTAIQVLGFARSLSKRPVSTDGNRLILRYGILNEAEIPFSDIEAVELSGKPLKQSDLTRKLSPLGDFESHNVIITLRKENALTGIYGIKKRFKVIGLYVDEPKEFKARIENALQ